jgi:aminobenzoyl-glutamate transport protein
MTDETPSPAVPTKRSAIDRFLSIVERAGNALPHPATLFASFALGIVLISDLAARLGISAVHPVSGEVVKPVSLLSIPGLHRILEQTVDNFTGFAPLGTVLVALIGIGICESSGFIGAVIRLVVLGAPARLLTVVVVFAGVMSNAASEVGYVLLVPLAGVVFLAVGRHPIVGMAAAFAGVSGGYSANLVLGTVDPLLRGITEPAARFVLPEYEVAVTCNYYFMFASTFLITALGTFVTERFVAPRFGAFRGDSASPELERLRPEEKRGLRFAFLTMAVIAAVILWGLVPDSGFLRQSGTGSVIHSPFLSGIVTVIFLAGTLMGIAYGVGARTVKSDADVVKGMSQQMSAMGGYLVLVFFAAQFVAFFGWSNLGLILAVHGAEFLRGAGLHDVPLFLAFILLSATINLAMGSASAKWGIMAPVFVPMFALLGYSPELTQAAYRVGDSVSNVISPMMSYFALIIAFFQKYEPKAGLGTVVATMLPYTFVFLIGWSVLFVAWLLLELPLGPGSPMFLPEIVPAEAS